MYYWECQHLEVDEKKMVRICIIYKEEVGRIVSLRGAFLSFFFFKRIKKLFIYLATLVFHCIMLDLSLQHMDFSSGDAGA